jgi:hypothetical protein
MGKPLVRFCEGQEFNCDMDQILWHRRESRRKQRKQTWSCSHGSLLSTRKCWNTGYDKRKKIYSTRNVESNLHVDSRQISIFCFCPKKSTNVTRISIQFYEF